MLIFLVIPVGIWIIACLIAMIVFPFKGYKALFVTEIRRVILPFYHREVINFTFNDANEVIFTTVTEIAGVYGLGSFIAIVFP